MALVGEAVVLLVGFVVVGFAVRFAVKGVVWLVDNHEGAAACVGFAVASLLWGWAEPDPQASTALPFVVAGLSLGAALFLVVFDMHQDREWIRRERDLLSERVAELEADRRADGV